MNLSAENPFSYETFKTQVEALNLDPQKKALALMLGTLAQRFAVNPRHEINVDQYTIVQVCFQIINGDFDKLGLSQNRFMNFSWNYMPLKSDYPNYENLDNRVLLGFQGKDQRFVEIRVFLTDGEISCLSNRGDLGEMLPFLQNSDTEDSEKKFGIFDDIGYPIVMYNSGDNRSSDIILANSAYKELHPLAFPTNP